MHPCLVPDLRGKASSLLPLSMLLAGDCFCRCVLSSWGRSNLFLVSWQFDIIKCFFKSLDIIISSSTCWCDGLDWLSKVKQVLHTWNKSRLVMAYSFSFIHCWIRCVIILLRIFAVERYQSVVFLSCNVCPILALRYCWPHRIS